jgi:hypothetical protein
VDASAYLSQHINNLADAAAPFRVASHADCVKDLGGEYGKIEMEYVYSTGIRGKFGIQIRVFTTYSTYSSVFQWNTLLSKALEYDVEYVFPF